mmetsp:Transcript_104800/g.208253  ORF Transcript_104800/g.208253 Transcript_104800/m.208253 type:complete len:81 (-) Transcript_104800:680-922(-)
MDTSREHLCKETLQPIQSDVAAMLLRQLFPQEANLQLQPRQGNFGPLLDLAQIADLSRIPVLQSSQPLEHRGRIGGHEST